ncbi:hypothetical protein ACLB2K_028809 [Fragaria x ananassa]
MEGLIFLLYRTLRPSCQRTPRHLASGLRPHLASGLRPHLANGLHAHLASRLRAPSRQRTTLARGLRAHLASGLCAHLAKFIPKHVQISSFAGIDISLFLAFIGLQSNQGIGLIGYNTSTLVTIGACPSKSIARSPSHFGLVNLCFCR